MIASWMPVQAMVHTVAAAPRGADAVRGRVPRVGHDPLACRSSARLALTVRIARSVPFSVAAEPADGLLGPPPAPCAIAGISTRHDAPTTSTAVSVQPSRTRSRTPIRTSVPTSARPALISPTMLDERLAQQHGVGGDPGDQLAGRAAGSARRSGRAKYRRTIDVRASSTTRSAERAEQHPLPERDHRADHDQHAQQRDRPGRPATRPAPSVSSTHLVTIGVARPDGVGDQPQHQADHQHRPVRRDEGDERAQADSGAGLPHVLIVEHDVPLRQATNPIRAVPHDVTDTRTGTRTRTRQAILDAAIDVLGRNPAASLGDIAVGGRGRPHHPAPVLRRAFRPARRRPPRGHDRLDRATRAPGSTRAPAPTPCCGSARSISTWAACSR